VNSAGRGWRASAHKLVRLSSTVAGRRCCLSLRPAQP
jgi:hypothetical protein